LLRKSAAPPSAPTTHERRHSELLLAAAVSLEPMQATLRWLALTLAGLSGAVWLGGGGGGRRGGRPGAGPARRGAGAGGRGGGARGGGRGAREGGGGWPRPFTGLLDRLQEAFEPQGRFTGDASHQPRTPLTAMLGQVEVALRRERPAEEYRRVLGLVRDQAD